MWFWLAFAVVVFIVTVCFLLFLYVQVELYVSTEGESLEGKARFQYFFGLLTMERRLSQVRPVMTDEGPSVSGSVHSGQKEQEKKHRVLTAEEVWRFLKNWRQWVEKLRETGPVINWLSHKTIVTRLESEMDLGTGEAAGTGIAVGAAYTVVYSAMGYLSRHVRLDAVPNISVHPDFATATFRLQQRCIFKIRLGYAIWAGIQSLRIWRKKRGRQDGSSDSRTHANRHDQYQGHG